MASLNLVLSLLLSSLVADSFTIIKTEALFNKEPMNCSATIHQCNASLYHITADDLTGKEAIASLYSVDVSHLKPIRHPNNEQEDYLVTVPCTCQNTSDLSGYFYQTTYKVKPNDTVLNISNEVFSGQAWILGNHSLLNINENLTINLLCGCSSSESQNDNVVTTYTVQKNDTTLAIAGFLNSTVDNMKNLNRILNQTGPSFISVGWVLFIPSDSN